MTTESRLPVVTSQHELVLQDYLESHVNADGYTDIEKLFKAI